MFHDFGHAGTDLRVARTPRAGYAANFVKRTLVIDGWGRVRYTASTLMGSSVLAGPGWAVVKTEAIPGCLEGNARPSPGLAVVFFISVSCTPPRAHHAHYNIVE